MDKITETIKRRYNRTALVYDWMDFMISDTMRRQVIGMVRGRVLEVGVGTGKNLPFYPPECQVTGIDFSPGMLERAKKKLNHLHLISLCWKWTPKTLVLPIILSIRWSRLVFFVLFQMPSKDLQKSNEFANLKAK